MMAQTDPRNDSRHEDTELHDVADVQTDRPNVIVTGSGGMIGREVCSRLAEMGYFVFGFDRVGFPEPPKGRFVRDVEFDVTDYSNVRWAIEDVRKARGNKLASVIQTNGSTITATASAIVTYPPTAGRGPRPVR